MNILRATTFKLFTSSTKFVFYNVFGCQDVPIYRTFEERYLVSQYLSLALRKKEYPKVDLSSRSSINAPLKQEMYGSKYHICSISNNLRLVQLYFLQDLFQIRVHMTLMPNRAIKALNNMSTLKVMIWGPFKNWTKS